MTNERRETATEIREYAITTEPDRTGSSTLAAGAADGDGQRALGVRIMEQTRTSLLRYASVAVRGGLAAAKVTSRSPVRAYRALSHRNLVILVFSSPRFYCCNLSCVAFKSRVRPRALVVSQSAERHYPLTMYIPVTRRLLHRDYYTRVNVKIFSIKTRGGDRGGRGGKRGKCPRFRAIKGLEIRRWTNVKNPY